MPAWVKQISTAQSALVSSAARATLLQYTSLGMARAVITAQDMAQKLINAGTNKLGCLGGNTICFCHQLLLAQQ